MAAPEDALEALLGGALAYGWPYSGQGRVDADAEPLRGWFHLADSGWLEFEALVDDPDGLGLRRPDAPAALFLSTKHGAALLLDVHERVGWSHNWGGSKASVHTYRSNALLFGVDFEDVASNRVERLSVRFYGLGGWAGLNMSETDVTQQAGGLVSSATLRLSSVTKSRSTTLLPRSLTLELDGDWVLGSELAGERRVTTALRVTVEAKRPRELSQLGQPLADLQDLLALVHGGLTTAAPANLRAGQSRVQPVYYWDARTMRHDPRAVLKLPTSDARVTLQQLGGINGLVRWCHLAQDHREVMHTVTSPYRDGPDRVDVTLLRLGVACEYWVSAHRKQAWARKQKKKKTYAHALAHRLGPAFGSYVGDPDDWAQAFWDAYLDAKHPRSGGADAELRVILAQTARTALIAALLNRCANSRKPGNAFLSDWRVQRWGEAFRGR